MAASDLKLFSYFRINCSRRANASKQTCRNGEILEARSKAGKKFPRLVPRILNTMETNVFINSRY